MSPNLTTVSLARVVSLSRFLSPLARPRWTLPQRRRKLYKTGVCSRVPLRKLRLKSKWQHCDVLASPSAGFWRARERRCWPLRACGWLGSGLEIYNHLQRVSTQCLYSPLNLCSSPIYSNAAIINKIEK